MKFRKFLTLLLALAMLLSLAACGKDPAASAALGKYNCIAVAYDGETFQAPDSGERYVELKKGGKATISEELTFEMTWKLEGEAFTGNYKIFGVDVPLTGTLKDGVLELHDDGVVTRYLKEGLEAPDWAKNLETAPNSDGRLAGRYTLFAMDIGGDHYDYAALVEMGEMDGSYLQIDYDEAAGYTGELCFAGEDPDRFTLDEQAGNLTFSDGTQTLYYESEEGVIGVQFEDLNSTIFYALPSVERPVPAPTEPTEAGAALLDWWSGDWYGWWFLYGCKGDYEELEGQYWDCEAHVAIDGDSTGTMELWDDSMSRSTGGIGLVDVSLSSSGTGEHGTLLSEGGWFMEMELGHADWIIDPGLTDFENMLIITGSYDDDNGNVYSYKLMLRPWGQLWDDVDPDSRPWSYEDWYLPMIQNGATRMSERFGEEDPSVYELQDYGKSNARATGEMDLEKLKACYETLHAAEDKYEMRYEDIRDLLGCDGRPSRAFQAGDTHHAYCWQSGYVILTVTFQIRQDGTETCSALAITGL